MPYPAFLQGAAGDHVSKIQVALFMLDNLIIDAGELSGKKYGPSTARAVLTFKRARNIIGSYQDQADDIVGKMTIAELDKELAKLENPPAGRVGCVSLGHRHHIYYYAGLDSRPKPSLQLGFLIAAATAASAGLKTAVPSVGDQAIMRLAFLRSRDLLGKAIKKMNKLALAIKRISLDAEDIDTLHAVEKWLHVDPNNTPAAVPTIELARDKMNRNLGLKTSDKTTPKNTDPPLRRGGPISLLIGGIIQPPDTNYGAVTYGNVDRGLDFGDQFFANTPAGQGDTVTHEFFHLCNVLHGGQPLNAPVNLKLITTPAQALDSADNLTHLVNPKNAPP